MGGENERAPPFAVPFLMSTERYIPVFSIEGGFLATPTDSLPSVYARGAALRALPTTPRTSPIDGRTGSTSIARSAWTSSASPATRTARRDPNRPGSWRAFVARRTDRRLYQPGHHGQLRRAEPGTAEGPEGRPPSAEGPTPRLHRRGHRARVGGREDPGARRRAPRRPPERSCRSRTGPGGSSKAMAR